ncbi:hypothetical protein PN434_06785 [Microcystis aeruginosa CS-558/01A06]|uniref:hypothetical protein n=1 Tax=Microcystis TaxID=1125 RepID=UPI0021AB8765|nr:MULTISPECIES: hypothetical protein [Microcystis]MDB9408238.1 hypothetical protein [Microcystis aeruginosa CS-558/01A06]
MSIVFDLERANQLSLLPDKDLVDLCPLIESYQVTKSHIHKDQYIETDFDLVITSLANAFFQTNLETGLFVWNPTPKEQIFLSKININNQEEALLKMYVARSKDLTANQTNNINCSRQKCQDQNCNFIPNYPKIFFDVNTAEPLQPWLPIEKIEDLLD